jgi:hypothetical protein
MEIRAEVAQDEQTSRWRWQGAAFEGMGELKKIFFSPVTFGTEQEARDEMTAHFAAELNSTGRLVRSKSDIAKLVSAAIQSCRACAGTESAPIYSHSPDERGRNWGLNYATGNMPTACLNEASQLIGHLRDIYGVQNEE